MWLIYLVVVFSLLIGTLVVGSCANRAVDAARIECEAKNGVLVQAREPYWICVKKDALIK